MSRNQLHPNLEAVAYWYSKRHIVAAVDNGLPLHPDILNGARFNESPMEDMDDEIKS